MQKLKNKPGSILRIKHFSDSENEEENKEMEVGENVDNQSEEEATAENNDSDFELTEENDKQKKDGKIRKKGIIYISSIPQHMNVAICRELMEQFGEVGRIFLQPDKKGSKLRISFELSSFSNFN
jgi:ESF2/ABP1 family protein